MWFIISIDAVPVSSYMSSKGVITEMADQNIHSAYRIMNKNDIGSGIILDKSGGTREKPVGLITERDVVRQLGTSNPRVSTHTIEQDNEQTIDYHPD